MYRLFMAALAAFGLASAALGHVTPNVTLVRRGDFVAQALPGATKFFEKTLGPQAATSVKLATGWMPTEDESKVYIGRDESGRLVGSVVFLWVPSEHGPVGLAVAFGPGGNVLEATVTDVGTEPLVWVRPLLHQGRLQGLAGIGHSQHPDPVRVAAGASGQMSRYYAQVIADGVWRAERIEESSGLER